MKVVKRTRPIPLPRYNDKRGWLGGDPKRLYTFIDERTGHITVRPGRWPGGGIGPAVTVRPATRSEAQENWQTNSQGWKVI